MPGGVEVNTKSHSEEKHDHYDIQKNNILAIVFGSKISHLCRPIVLETYSSVLYWMNNNNSWLTDNHLFQLFISWHHTIETETPIFASKFLEWETRHLNLS